MNDMPTKVLLVEDNAADAKLVQAALANATGQRFRVEWLTDLPASLEKLSRAKYEVILLDLALAGAQELSVFDQVFAAAPDALILILMLVGAIPSWPHSRNWGYGPSGGLGLVVLILVVLLLLGRI